MLHSPHSCCGVYCQSSGLVKALAAVPLRDVGDGCAFDSITCTRMQPPLMCWLTMDVARYGGHLYIIFFCTTHLYRAPRVTWYALAAHGYTDTLAAYGHVCVYSSHTSRRHNTAAYTIHIIFVYRPPHRVVTVANHNNSEPQIASVQWRHGGCVRTVDTHQHPIVLHT